MKHTGHLFRDNSLKVMVLSIIAGYSGHAFTADLGKSNTKEETLVVSAAASQGEEDENTLVAHNAAAATKSSQPISRTSQSISVVTQAEIATHAARNIPQALRYVSGVTSENSGADTRFDTIIVRGFEADEYLDGLRLPREAWWSRPAWDPFLLSRIEVVKGPSSVLYGQANPGGIVNIVSKTPQATPAGQIYVSSGNHNQFGTGFDTTGALNDSQTLLGRVAGTFFDTETQVAHTRYQHYDIAPSFTWQPDAQTSLTLLSQLRKDPDSGFYNQMPTSGTLTHNPFGKISTGTYIGQPGYDKYQREQGSVGYQFRHDFNDIVTFRQNVRYLSSTGRYRMVYPLGIRADAPLVDRATMNIKETMSNFAMDNQAEFHLQSGPVQHTLLAGIDRIHTSVRSRSGYGDAGSINYLDPDYNTAVDDTPYTSSTHNTLDQTGLYLQDQMELNNWILSLAGRYDDAKTKNIDLLSDSRTERNDYVTTGRAGLLYHFDNGLAPYISYSTSFVPSSSNDYNGHPFKPTRGKQSEIGLKYDPVGLDALFTVALYNLRETNMATTDTDHPGFSIQTGEVRSQGLELDGRINITPAWTVLGSWNLISQTVRSANDGTQGKHPVGVSRNTAKLWSQYAFNGALDGFSVGGGVRYMGTSYANTSNTLKVPAATVYDARVAYQWRQWQLALNADNIGNKTYIASCNNLGCEYALKRQYVATVSYAW